MFIDNYYKTVTYNVELGSGPAGRSERKKGPIGWKLR